MQAAAEERNYACDIHAYPVAEAREHEKDADMVLLGPQVHYMPGKVKEDCPNCAVEAIDMKAYGTMDGKSMREKHDRSCDHGAGGKERITAGLGVISLDAAEHM